MDENSPSPEELAMQKAQQFAMSELFSSCPAKTILGVGAGFGMGAAFGLIFGANTFNNHDEKFLNSSFRNQARVTFKQMGQGMLSSGKTFASLSAVFVATECATESIRGKEDMYNGLISGCVTGAVLSRSGGVQAMALGT